MKGLDIVAFVACAVVAALLIALPTPSASIVRAYGIVSPCGVHAVIVVRSNGESELYDAEHTAPSDVEQEVLALPETQRGGVLVPCESSGPVI